MAEHGVGGGIAGLGAQMAVGLGVGNAMAGGDTGQNAVAMSMMSAPRGGMEIRLGARLT